MRTDLIKELSPKSKALSELCNDFVERTQDVPHIISFFESKAFDGHTVSAQLHGKIMVSLRTFYL